MGNTGCFPSLRKASCDSHAAQFLSVPNVCGILPGQCLVLYFGMWVLFSSVFCYIWVLFSSVFCYIYILYMPYGFCLVLSFAIYIWVLFSCLLLLYGLCLVLSFAIYGLCLVLSFAIYMGSV